MCRPAAAMKSFKLYSPPPRSLVSSPHIFNLRGCVKSLWQACRNTNCKWQEMWNENILIFRSIWWFLTFLKLSSNFRSSDESSETMVGQFCRNAIVKFFFLFFRSSSWTWIGAFLSNTDCKKLLLKNTYTYFFYFWLYWLWTNDSMGPSASWQWNENIM